jgi:hypothetical protein
LKANLKLWDFIGCLRLSETTRDSSKC